MATVPLSVRIDERTKRQMAKVAKAERRSLAVMVEVALNEWLASKVSP